MRISDSIEKFILELLKGEESWIELNRREIAEIFHCVPSNINYVMETRFRPEQGFIVESKRGGGGCIRIKKISADTDTMRTINAIGKSIDYNTASILIKALSDSGILSVREANIILSGLTDKAISVMKPECDYIRASVLKNMLSVLDK